MDRVCIAFVMTLAACGGSARPSATTAATTAPAAEAPAAALTAEECGAAYQRLQWEVPLCEVGVECTILERTMQQTVVPAGDQRRRDHSCARLRPRAWYECAMKAPTWSAWHSCGPALLPAYQPVPAGKGPHRLARGVAYVVAGDIITVSSIAGGRATVVNIDTSTDERRELVVEVNGELDLTHEYPPDPPDDALPPDLYENSAPAPLAPPEPEPEPAKVDGIEVLALVRLGGPRFRVVAIAADHVVVERLPPREIIVKDYRLPADGPAR